MTGMLGTGAAGVLGLIDVARQENARADTKAAALLAVVGLGFTTFSVSVLATAGVRVDGVSIWPTVAALAFAALAAEFLLLVIRPQLRLDRGDDRYFGYWATYVECPDRLAAELGTDVADCRLLARISQIVLRKYRLIRWAVDGLLLAVPLVSFALGSAALTA